ncbi:baseplate hub protein [Burkholderia phage Maja]|uniref:Baseplate hub protein n=1 Tax=Burkholderia phage Maja TaxID=2767571 RepID=A0A7S6R890_9CAUD|nr:baseplate hub protein [Burkholderia phage Maja]
MRTRVLEVTFTIDGEKVVLDQSLNLKVNIKKNCFVMQSRATIDVMNLSKTVRERLLSRFTAWKKRVLASSPEGTVENPIDVEIRAGYKSPPNASSVITVDRGFDEISTVFNGQISLVDPISGPPDIATRITCQTRQMDRSTFKSRQSPTKVTLREYVQWVNKELRLGQEPEIDTTHADDVLTNPATSMVTLSSLVTVIQTAFGMVGGNAQGVYAFIDDGRLIVKDANKIFNRDNIPKLTEFVSTPLWNEYGVSFTTLFDSKIKLAQGVNLTSVMNDAVNGDYVVYLLEYQLTSRDAQFYVTGFGSPPA